jgi:O-antigen/teichoic acid export membrane protein
VSPIVQRGTLSNELIWVIAGQVSAFFGSVVGLKLLTSQLGPAVFGELALALTVGGVITMLFYGPVAQVVLRFYGTCRDSGSLGAYRGLVHGASNWLGSGVIVTGVCLAIAVYFIAGPKWARLVLLGVLFGIASGILGLQAALRAAMRLRRSAALFMGLDAWLKPILAIGLMALIDRSADVALTGYCAGSIVVALFQGTSLRPMVAGWVDTKSPEATLKTQFVTYAWPFAVFSVLGAVSQYADRWLVQVLQGETAVGIYAALYQLASAPILLLMGIFNQFAVPIIFDLTQDQKRARVAWRMIVGAGLLLLMFVAGVAFMFARPIISVFASPLFVPHADALWLLVLGIAFFQMGQVLITSGLVAYRSSVYVRAKVFQATTLVAIAWPLTSFLGVIGTSLALLASSTIYLAAVVFANRSLVYRDSTQ